MRWSGIKQRAVWLAMGCAVALSGLPLGADDTVVGSVGGKWQALNSDHICMVSETVKVRLGRERADVQCEFTFTNEGPAQKVKVGFPQKLGTAPLHNFRCRVDGKSVPVRSRVAKVNKERIDSETAHIHPYEGWHWSWMSFDAGQTRRVSHTYEAQYTEDSMGGRAFLYVMQSGATWKGSIGDAVVEVDLGPVANAGICKVTPSGYKAEGNRLTWHWQDFEPQSNIRVEWVYDPKVVIEVPFAQKDGRDVRLDLAARECKRGDTIFAPVRWMAEIVGAKCRWDPETQSVALVPKSGRELRITVGSTSAQSDWGPVPFGHTAYRLNGQVMAPIRPVADWLGLSVQFDAYGYYWVRISRAS